MLQRAVTFPGRGHCENSQCEVRFFQFNRGARVVRLATHRSNLKGYACHQPETSSPP